MLLEAGSALVGMAGAISLPDVTSEICRRGGLGFFGDMGWLLKSAERRGNPGLHMKDARSIVCTAWCYPTDSSFPMARFAVCEDYHAAVFERLKGVLVKFFSNKHKYRIFVDSGAIAEKAYAARAGLGWVGKNGVLINKDIGSFFCLGLVLTDAAFDEYDSPAESLCGGCEKCVKACPTGAIVAPGVLDCRRCVSYLTIEHKGEIPKELQEKMGGWVFGCDVCQEACPYNTGLQFQRNVKIALKIGR